jgi:hypothetical protein
MSETRTPKETVMIPRRICIDQNTPAELAIRAAIRAVEDAGADVRLTDAVVLLGAALESVSDVVDGVRPITRRFWYPKPEQAETVAIECLRHDPPVEGCADCAAEQERT